MSFVIPADFEFLKRSGRLTPLAAKLGSKLRLLPVLTQTEDKKRIAPVGVRRSWGAAAGHCWPVFARFRGGKAVAAMYGFLFGLVVCEGCSVLIFLLPLSVFLVILYLTKIVSLSSIGSAVAVTVYAGLSTGSVPVTAALALFTLLIVVRHRGNIERIVQHRENKITWM